MIFRDVEQKIVKDLNESGLSIDAIYFIMKSIMQEVEQKYFEFCRQEDIEKIKNEEKIDEIDNNDNKGTN